MRIYPEDSKTSEYIEIDIVKAQIINSALPVGYEWSKLIWHIREIHYRTLHRNKRRLTNRKNHNVVLINIPSILMPLYPKIDKT